MEAWKDPWQLICPPRRGGCGGGGVGLGGGVGGGGVGVWVGGGGVGGWGGIRGLE